MAVSKKEKTLDLDFWCQSAVNGGHITATLIILAHVIWFFAARNHLAWPREIYLRYWIIYPAIGFLILNGSVDYCVRRARLSLVAKEYLSLSLFIIYSVYLTLTHDIAKVLLCSYILPIIASAIFSNIKLTRRIFYTSIVAVWLPALKLYLENKLDSDMIMEIFVSCFMFVCSFLVAKIIIKYCHDNLVKIIQSQEEAKKIELAFLQVQIKPHFLYNAISAIVSFCYTDSEKAADLLINFSKYLRLVFDVDRNSMMVPLKQEIELTKAYMEIEVARFGEQIQVEYHIDPDLLDMEIPSFCIQPLVENAIKHGVCQTHRGGTVSVKAEKEGDSVVITVQDNGVGIVPEKLAELQNIDTIKKGVGFYNVARRLTSWNHSRIDIKSEVTKGTTVTITI